MISYREIDDRLNDAKNNSQYNLLFEIWNKIKGNKKILEWAITPTKNTCGERDIVNGLSISELILRDSENVDKDIYQKLVNVIYSHKQIAGLCFHGPNDDGSTYLMLTLMNPKLRLTEEQKEFAVNEALNTYNQRGEYDLRYWILRNQNWSLFRKKKLVMDFWTDSDEYDRSLDTWEWDIVNQPVNYINGITDKDELFECDYRELLDIYDDEKITDEIWDEMQFCRLMHEIRPTQIEQGLGDIEEISERIYY